MSVTDPEGRTVFYEWGSVNEKKALIYPDGRRAEYRYNDRGLLESLTTAKGTVNYEYDKAGRLSKKELPNGVTTSYSYNGMGRIEQILHEGEGLSEAYSYTYDSVGNKILAEKQRRGMEADHGSFGYVYDALNRLVQVTQNGKALREYQHDAFGNRTVKKEYNENAERTIEYRYNERNQLIAEIENGLEKNYRYDRRGNMTEVSMGEKLVKQFVYDAANQMSSSMEIVGNLIKKAEYRYNGLRQRLGQDIWSLRADGATTDGIAETAPMPEKPEESIRYILDLTTSYHNMLCLETENRNNTFYWDKNTAIIEDNETEFYYLQDDLGSPMRLLDGKGEDREIYGFDEFGIALRQNTTQIESGISKHLQPFGFTGYQMEEAGRLYFAQARRYDAGLGRFVSEDFIKGSVAVPLTLNPYGYCWNRPLDLVDLNGLWPSWSEIKEQYEEQEIGFKVLTVIGAVALVALAIVTAPALTTIGAAVLSISAAAAVGGVVNGFAHEANGGSYTTGYAGGAVSGSIQGGLGYYAGPGGLVIGGAGNGVGSIVTDWLDNIDPNNDNYKTSQEIVNDATNSAANGVLLSLPAAFIGLCVKEANAFSSVTRDLMPTYSPGFGEGLNQFYGTIDNLLLPYIDFGFGVESKNFEKE